MSDTKKWPPESGLAREIYDEVYAYELEYPQTTWSKLLTRAAKELVEREQLVRESRRLGREDGIKAVVDHLPAHIGAELLKIAIESAQAGGRNDVEK